MAIAKLKVGKAHSIDGVMAEYCVELPPVDLATSSGTF